MKKYMVLCAGLCVVFAFTSCKSNESAYRKMYEKAQAQEQSQAQNEQYDNNTPVVTPIVEKSSNDTKVVDNYDNVSVREEKLTVVDGSGLKDFSVVVGSFSVKVNAEGLTQQLRSAGYSAQIAYNSQRNMYRVIASTFDNKGDAVRSRNDFRATYPDAWLLYNQK